MKLGNIIELEVYAEQCCDTCGEIIHNHIDCPVCNNRYAGTDNYYDLNDEPNDNVICDCGAEFRLISGDWYYDNKVEIVKL